MENGSPAGQTGEGSPTSAGGDDAPSRGSGRSRRESRGGGCRCATRRAAPRATRVTRVHTLFTFRLNFATRRERGQPTQKMYTRSQGRQGHRQQSPRKCAILARGWYDVGGERIAADEIRACAANTVFYPGDAEPHAPPPPAHQAADASRGAKRRHDGGGARAGGGRPQRGGAGLRERENPGGGFGRAPGAGGAPRAVLRALFVARRSPPPASTPRCTRAATDYTDGSSTRRRSPSSATTPRRSRGRGAAPAATAACGAAGGCVPSSSSGRRVLGAAVARHDDRARRGLRRLQERAARRCARLCHAARRQVPRPRARRVRHPRRRRGEPGRVPRDVWWCAGGAGGGAGGAHPEAPTPRPGAYFLVWISRRRARRTRAPGCTKSSSSRRCSSTRRR